MHILFSSSKTTFQFQLYISSSIFFYFQEGLVHATILGFEYMSTKNCGLGGIIVNRSSIFGVQPFYPMPVYTGTEHFIIGFTRSMGNNYFFNQSKVKVMAFCPGVTETRNPFEPNQGQFGKFEELGKEAQKALKCLPSQGLIHL